MDGAIDSTGHFKENNTVAPDEKRVFSLFSLKDKTAIVAGAGAGIGLQVALAFAEAGANVAIWYHSNDDAVKKAKAIEEAYGIKCRAYQIDTTHATEVEELVEKVVKDFNGRLDIFVANAGVPWKQGPALEGSLSHYKTVMTIDLDGTYYCARAAGAVFRRQHEKGNVDAYGNKLTNYRGGSFIATASMSAHIVNIPQLQTAYNAAKAGVIHMCKSLAVEWVKFARVNTVSPGYIATEISDFLPPETKRVWHQKTPMGREGEPHELKGTYLFLASDASSYATGMDMVVDGGYSIP